MIRKCLLLAALCSCLHAVAGSVVWFDGTHPITYQVQGRVDAVVMQAIQMFSDDMLQVTGLRPVSSRKATIRIVQGKGCDDGFRLSVSKGQLVVYGHNARGTAYGLLELSRMAGVSPWVWWGDVVPESKERLTIDDGFVMEHTPSVQYRGIFINDEDWSLRNWSWKTFEPRAGIHESMGPKTYKAIFQLMLRLRANTLWPAMHTGTPGFFTIAGNKEMADSFAIVLGSSHCEPLLRNNVAEWDHVSRGPYNYITNRDKVQQYWIERLQQVKGSETFFTIGMRGIHDGSMEGVKTAEEKLKGLQQVIDDQRELIGKYYSKNVESVPQVFIPYKEVLEIMENGLRVPDDVTLMWCDDNYGYMTRLSDAEQQRRSGGGGVYYHLSYWGRPHDYLWLATTQPGLVYSEMKAAYDHNCRRLWIANVHDPKVAAYPLELFLDMAWDINSIVPSDSNVQRPTFNVQRSSFNVQRSSFTLHQHLERWLCTQFGEEVGKAVFPAMKEFYRLCAIRKPEFMGWTQVELDKNVYPRGRSQVIDTEFSLTEFGDELESYLADFAAVSQTVRNAEKLISPELKDAFFAHVKYPVLAANAMAVKMLEAQKARSRYLGQTDKSMEGREDYMQQAAARSMAAYREIQRLTDYYNRNLSGGKWAGMMNMMPRDLYVFWPPSLPYLGNGIVTSAHYKRADSPANDDVIAVNACDYDAASKGCQTIQMLGHSMNAVAIPKDGELIYHFDTAMGGEAVLYTAMIPTQPSDKGDLRYRVSIDGQEPVTISLKEKFRSDFWKKSVLRGQALKTTKVIVAKGQHTLRIKALDHHVVADQWMLDFKPSRKFYVIPVGAAQ